MGKSFLRRIWRPPARRQPRVPALRFAGLGRKAARASVVGRKEVEEAAAARPGGPGVKAVGARGPGGSRHGVAGAAAAPAGSVGRAHRGLVPRPGAEQVHQQLPPIPVAVPAAAAHGPAPGEWAGTARGKRGAGGKTGESCPNLSVCFLVERAGSDS